MNVNSPSISFNNQFLAYYDVKSPYLAITINYYVELYSPLVKQVTYTFYILYISHNILFINIYTSSLKPYPYIEIRVPPVKDPLFGEISVIYNK